MALADFLITLLTFVAVYGLFGISLNLKYGFTGLVDFGHVAYFMIGAYVTVVQRDGTTATQTAVGRSVT